MTAVAEETDAQAAAMAELDKLGPAPESVTPDEAPQPKRRRSRSGTSGAARARAQKAAAEGGPKASVPRKRTGAPKIADGMAQLYTMVGIGVTMVPSGVAAAVPPGVAPGASITAVVGTTLTANAGAIGAAWEEAAKADPRVKDALEKLLAVSVLGQIVAAHVPVLMAGIVAAGAAPAQLVGFEAVTPAAPAGRAHDGQNTGGRP